VKGLCYLLFKLRQIKIELQQKIKETDKQIIAISDAIKLVHYQQYIISELKFSTDKHTLRELAILRTQIHEQYGYDTNDIEKYQNVLDNLQGQSLLILAKVYSIRNLNLHNFEQEIEHMIDDIKKLNGYAFQMKDYIGDSTDRILRKELKSLHGQRDEQNATKMRMKVNLKALKVKDIVATKKIRIKCPVNSCRGFILSDHQSDLECKICNSEVCYNFMCVKNANHVCDSGELASVANIRDDSTSCPGCGISISRIYGCNEMYCTDCGTPFNYHTGKILTSEFHNPNERNWSRNKSKGIVSKQSDHYQCRLLAYLPDGIFDNPDQMEAAKNMIDGILHIQDQMLSKMAYQAETAFMKNRVRYILGQQNEKAWTTQIWRIERKNNHMQEVRTIFQTLIDISHDMRVTVSDKEPGVWLYEIKIILENARTALSEVATEYNLLTSYLDQHWRECQINGKSVVTDHETTCNKKYHRQALTRGHH